jgi:hypothetical protein
MPLKALRRVDSESAVKSESTSYLSLGAQYKAIALWRT